MKEIIKRTKSQYIIIRRKGDGKEYFNGANIYGRDNVGILLHGRLMSESGKNKVVKRISFYTHNV